MFLDMTKGHWLSIYRSRFRQDAPPTEVRRRSLRGALHNFLGTLTSRYSDFDGHWVLGLIVEELGETTIDLLGKPEADAEATPLGAFIRMARDRFQEQLGKQRIPGSFVSSGLLEITKPSARTEGHVNGHVRPGYDVAFLARVESDLHTVYASKTTVLVAPHDPDIETRSARREPRR
jgi:hypothetical protein